MDMQAEKIELVKLLLDTDNPELISKIRSAFNEDESSFYNTLPEHVKEDIEIALKEIENGEVYDHDDVMREFKMKYGINN